MTTRDLLPHLPALEQRLHDPTVRADAAQLEALLADDFTEVGRSGRRYDRTGIIGLLLAESLDEAPSVDVSDAHLREWPGAALLTYRSAHRQPDGTLTRPTWRSSLWRDEGPRGWRMAWHQGTACAGASTAAPNA